MEHGLPDDWAQHSARLALESRAFPYLSYDPGAGPSITDCLTLEGNPSPDAPWPTYTLAFEGDAGPSTLELPLTIADWAATEARFKQHFAELAPGQGDATLLPFHEYLAADAATRDGRQPFIYAVGKDRRLRRLSVAGEIFGALMDRQGLHAEERQEFWSLLRQLAGLQVAPAVRETIAGELEAEYQRKADALRAEFEAKHLELEREYPRRIARRLAEGLLRTSGGSAAVTELLASLPPSPGAHSAPTIEMAVEPAAAPAPAPPPEARERSEEPTRPAAAAVAPAVATMEEPFGIDAYIDSIRCTSCNECTNLNNRMFSYNAEKQAFVKDATAGSFQQLVLAAERCPVSIIHPGTPLNPKEKDLAKWVQRAERFA